MDLNESEALRIYLAGPTVFFRDADAAYRKLEQLCDQRGMHAVRPAEPVDGNGLSLTGPVASRFLFEQNILRIRQAAGVLADLRPFRGALEPDSGTVFEVGYAHALGKPVAALVPDARSWGERIRNDCGVGELNDWGGEMDATHDMLIEDFGGALNLMLAESCKVFTDADSALDWLCTMCSAGPSASSGADIEPIHRCQLQQ